jgi:hypothetical protein
VSRASVVQTYALLVVCIFLDFWTWALLMLRLAFILVDWLIDMPMQGLEAELPRAELQLSQSQADDIIKALKQLNTAVDSASGLLQQWSVSGRKGMWGAVQNFAFSKQDGQDLLEVSACLTLLSLVSTCVHVASYPNGARWLQRVKSWSWPVSF